MQGCPFPAAHPWDTDILNWRDRAQRWSQDLFASLQVPHELVISEVAQTPLVPYQAVFVVLTRLPLLQANVEHLANALLLCKLLRKLGYGFHYVDFLCYI